MLPFTARQALSAGFTKNEIRRQLAQRKWHRTRLNAYVVSSFNDLLPPLIRQAGSVLPQLVGNPAVSHESAAALWRLAHLSHSSTHIQVTRDRRAQGRCDYEDLIVHHAKLPGSHVCTVHSIPITTVTRTIVDITRIRGMRAGLVAAEASLNSRISGDLMSSSVAELRSTVAACRGWPQVRTARWVIDHASTLSESPLESISRAAFFKYAVPQPDQQVQLADDIRVDFLWRNADVVGESDGTSKYHMTLDAFNAEKSREQRLIDMGYTVLRWGWDDAFANPERLADRIKQALASKGVAVPRAPSSWRSVGKSWFLPPEYRLVPLGWAENQI